jgi:parvulin-like peptidyl-prolyl isomerase
MNEVVFSMDKVNEVRGPVKTDRGFELLQLIERKDGDVRPLSEVKDQIRGQLYQQQLEKQTQSWIAELRKKAHLEVRF